MTKRIRRHRDILPDVSKMPGKREFTVRHRGLPLVKVSSRLQAKIWAEELAIREDGEPEVQQ